MKKIIIICSLALILSFGICGCESQWYPGDNKPVANNGLKTVSVYTQYAPVKVRILPLTEFEGLTENAKPPQIHLYVTLLDSFGSQIKSPAVFRFELYEKAQLSSQPKGRRIVLWPDIDLIEPVANNQYWSDFLGAYEFNLNFEPVSNKTYVLQATSMCPKGKRLSAEMIITAP